MNENSKNKQPIAYQKGEVDFYGHNFVVSPAVLIPRPETEQLIDLVLSLAGKAYLPGMKCPDRVLPKTPIIVDVGTGSGCIAITLALLLPEAKVYASDISQEALKIAQKNALRHKVTIPLIISHLMQNVNIKPDLVVANLPYVDAEWDWLDREALSYEPETALYAKNHGLTLIFELINEACQRQVPYLALEADPCQHKQIIDYANTNHYALFKKMGFGLCFKNDS